MAGASRAHNQIAANLLRHLGNQLQGKPCAVLGSDMRLRIRKSDVSFYYYPNVTVDCSGSKKDEVEEPSVIFEVLSPATDWADRGDKLTNYHAIASMRVYVLVNQLQAAISVFRRTSEGEWRVEHLSGSDATLELPEIGCTLPLAAIYERVLPVA